MSQGVNTMIGIATETVPELTGAHSLQAAVEEPA